MRTRSSPERRSAEVVARPPDGFWVWPRRRSTAVALLGLIGFQAVSFFLMTRRSFFFHDDFNYFALAQERDALRYVLTPILGVYPAPGDRVASLLLQLFAPMDFTVARIALLVVLALATFALWQLVRTLAMSDRWWTVAVVVPFALSLTLTLPIAWWSAGLPIIPALFFTVIAVSAWLRAYDEPEASRFWIGLAVLAVAAAGAFYLKFLLIPVYLLFIRLVILPRIHDLPGGPAGLWRERMRWIAVAVPPAAYLAVFVLGGFAGRTAVEGSRPYLEYLVTAWFRVFVPVSFLNARLVGEGPSVPAWILLALGQASFWITVVATWRRSTLALRAWALVGIVFLLNVLVVGGVRLAAFGVEIAYALRYYPEVVLFVPVALALCLRQGSERRDDVAWERTTPGQVAIGAMSAILVGGYLLWAPAVVGEAEGVAARPWYENLRRDLDALATDGSVPRIVDSETPDFVIAGWMAPSNRVSTVLGLVPVDVVFNAVHDPIYLVREDGHLAEAAFRPAFPIVLDGAPVGDLGSAPRGTGSPRPGCVGDGVRLVFRPDAVVAGERLAMRIAYADADGSRGALIVDADDPERPHRYLALRPDAAREELIDLGTSRVRGFRIEAPPGGELCVERAEIGTLVEGDA